MWREAGKSVYTTVRTQANIIKNTEIVSRPATSSKEGGIKKKKGKKYEIGILLVEFMWERELIIIETITPDGEKAIVKEKKKSYY